MADHSSEPVDIVGTVLNKKYEVQQRLSQGGMGAVSYTHLDVYKRQPERLVKP